MNSTGYNWATQDPAGIAAGGLDAYYANINKLLTDPSSNLSGAQAAMQQYGISPEDIQAATGRTLESFYPSAGALAQATGSTNPINVLALGDSTTWGWYGGNQVANNMVASAQNRLGSGYNLTNQGVNSTAISDLFGTPEYQNSLSSNADVVALNYGMNEAYRGVPIEDFRNNLLRAVDDFQKAGKKVILQTPNATSSTDPWAQNVSSYAQVVRDVANATGSTLQDKYAKTSGMEGATSSFDPIHPTEATYGLLGSDFADVIQGLYAPSTGAVVQTTTPATTASMDTQAQTGSVQAPTTSGTSGALDTVASQQVDTPSASAGYLWATQDPAGIAAGGLNNYYNNINRLVSDPSSTLASTQSAMSQYGISPEDVLAATGRSLESFYPSTGALSQTTLPSTTSATAGALTQASAPTQDVSATQGALSTVAPTTQQSVASTTTDAISTERENPFPAGSTISAWYESLPESGEGITKSLIGYEASRYGVGSVQNTYAKNPAFSEWASSYQTNLDVENARKGILSDDNPYETGTNASIVYASLPVDQKNILLSNPYAKTTFNALIESKGDEAGARAFLAREQKISDLASQIAGGAVEDQYWTGYGYGGKSQNSLAMATWLSQNGITDLGQLGVKAQQVTEPIHQIGTDAQGKPIYGKYNFYNLGGDTGSVSILEPVDDPSKVSIVNGQPVYVVGSRPAFYNKQTGRELGDISYGGRGIHYVADEMLPSDFSQVVPGKVYQVGQTFAGEGGTAYNVVFDQQGKPNFFTSWTGSTSDAGTVSSLLAVASLVPGPIGIGAGLLNAGIALDQGNEAGAILSLLGAGANYYGGQLTGMTTPGSPAAVSGLDLASDVATLGANPAVQIQNTLSNLNTAKTGVQIASALQNQDPSALITSLATTAAGQAVASQPIGDTGLTVGEVVKGTQVANLVNNGQFAQAATLAGDLVNSPDLKVAGLGASILQEVGKENPDFNKIIGYATQLDSAVKSAGEPKPAPKGDLGERIYDDTIVSAGAKAFEDAKRAGATDQEAMEAANAVTAPAKPTYDQGEFEGLGEAQAAAKAASTVAIGNAEADTPEEAMALARARNPNAGSFTFGGQEYTITASPGQMTEMTRNAQLSEIKDLPTFSEAYAKARDLLGPNQSFEWGGKQYSTATFAERPDLAGNVVPGAAATDAGAGRGSYAGYDSAEDMVNKVKSTPVVTDYSGQKVFGIPIGTPQDAINTVNRMGEVVMDFSRGIGTGFGNFMNQVGTLAHIASASASGGDTTNTLIGRDNLLSSMGKDLAAYYNGMTTEQSNKEWNNIVKDVSAAPEYLKPFVAVQSTLQNFGGFVNRLGGEVGEEIAPIMTGLGIGSKLLQLGASGTAKTIAITSTLGDMAESAQGSYDNVMERLKDNKNLTPEEKHWASTQAAATGMAATAVFGYGANAYLAKSIMGDMVGNAAQKVLGPLAVDYITEYPESVIQTLGDRFAEKGSINAQDVRDANTDGAISALLDAKTSGTIAGTVQVVGRVTNEFVGAPTGEKGGIAVVQSPDGQVAFVPAGDLKIGQELNVDNLPQLQTPSEVVDQFNFAPEEASRVAESVNNLIETKAERQEAADQEEMNFDASQIDINSALGSDVGAQAQANAGVTTATDAATGVTTTTDANSNTTTTVDPNTNTTTQIQTDPNTNTQTTTTINSNTNVNTQTTVNSNTNVTTETSVNTNTNVATQVTTDPNTNTETTVTTDPNTNTQTTVIVDTKTNTVVDTNVTVTPPDYSTPVIEVAPPSSEVATPTTTPSTTKASTPGQTVQAPTSLQAYSGDAGLVGAGAMGLPSGFEIDPALLPSKQTQKAIDPLARVMQAQAELEKTAMMQQIDPRLLSVLQQRAAPEQQVNQQQQFDRDIGALSQILSGQPQAPANEGSYYSYGSESSIDDVLGGRAVGYKQGGYVAPLMAQGGMALPLLAKSGGALSHYEGRENFKDGKHVAGEGDGQSDDIPAWLADGEFVFPADVVSALGNGSTKAGTDKLYEMMHNIRDRARSTGEKDLPPPALKSPLDYLKSRKRSQ